MGSALLQCWLDHQVISKAIIIEPNDIPTTLSQHQSITHLKTKPEQALDCDVLVLAVKPQIMSNVCADIMPFVDNNTLILSIAAGQNIEKLQSYFKTSQPIIRSMPNTPAAIGKGISVAVPNSHVSVAHKEHANALLTSTGKFIWMPDETLMDAVTALSGSGPAYVFYMIDILCNAGKALGLTEDHAMQLARQTVIGSAALAETEENISAETLRKNVTSPGGTTEAALKVLMDGRLQSLFTEALTAARDRGLELNS